MVRAFERSRAARSVRLRFAVILIAAFSLCSADAVRGQTCTADVSKANSCTAGDVKITIFTVSEVVKPCGFPGDTAEVRLRAKVVGNSDRYDIGMFVALDGGDALHGSCLQDYLTPPLTPDCALDPGSQGAGGTCFLNLDSDACGDIRKNVENFHDVNGGEPVLIKCEGTPDDPTHVYVDACVGWTQTNRNDCSSIAQAVPGAPSKCGCSTQVLQELPIPGCLSDADCTDPEAPFCDVGSGSCVECAQDADCPDTEPSCNDTTNTCEGCDTDADCTDPAAPVCQQDGTCGECTPADLEACAAGEVCEPTEHVCVECVSSSDCPDTEPSCNDTTNTCEGCDTDADCTDPAAPVCLPDGTCGECTPGDLEACAAGEVCEPTEHVCVECVSSSDCPDTEPSCNDTTNTCEGCDTDADCTDPAAPVCQQDGTCGECTPADLEACAAGEVCEPTEHVCVECVSSSDCPDTEPSCNDTTNTCEGCDTDADCTDPASPVCQQDGTCGECTPADLEACAAGEVCEPTEHVCVECVSSSDCPDTEPSCNDTTNTCEGCDTDADCTDPAAPVCQQDGTCGECTPADLEACAAGEVCEPTEHVCVECVSSSDCPDTEPSCNDTTNTCEGCDTDADCTDPAAPVCLPDGTCGECTPADLEACAAGEVCEPTEGVCVECVSSSDCPDTEPSCNDTTNTCEGCDTDADCTDPASPVCQQDGTCGECTPADLEACAAGEVCEPTEHVCVECVSSSDCPDTEPSCNDTTHTCEGCDTDADCTDPAAPVCQQDGTCGECTPGDLEACAAGEVCEPTEGECVECVSSSDCPDTEPSCNDTTHTCEGCDTDADCTDPAAPVCQQDGTCGECTPADLEACAAGEVCEPTEHVCVECVSSSDCPDTEPSCNDTTNTCEGCDTDADCTDPAAPVCQQDGTCGECTPADLEACAAGEVCEPTEGECVECVSSSDCPDTEPSCNETTNTCEGCDTDADCTDPASPVCQQDGTCGECTPADLEACAAGEVCEPTEHVCVECVSSSDCPDTEPSCNDTTNTCEGCDTDADCTDPAAPVCQSDGSCSECSATDTGLCTDGEVCQIDEGVCVAGAEGCSPGWWKTEKGLPHWTAPYDPGDLFDEFFENAFPGKTLFQVLTADGGGLTALGRQTVAALLNAADPGLSYPIDPSDVIQEFNESFPGTKDAYNALKQRFDEMNHTVCPYGSGSSSAASLQESGAAPSETFLCYGATDAAPEPFSAVAAVELDDSREQRVHDVTAPSRLCTPARVSPVGSTAAALGREETHLEGYAIAATAPPILEPPFEACEACSGGVASVVFRYVGAGGRVLVTKLDGTVLHDSVADLTSNDLVQVWGDPMLGAGLLLAVDGEPSARFATDCSLAFGPGLEAGAFQVVTAQGQNGVDLCPLMRVDNEISSFFTPALGAQRLLVPTVVDSSLSVEQVAGQTNHFKCYDVWAGTAGQGILVSVTDRFATGRWFEIEGAVAVCHPVRETIDGLTAEIVDEQEQLACYAVTPVGHCGASNRACKVEEDCGGTSGVTAICRMGSNAAAETTTENQFGDGRLRLERAEELCVPTAVRVGP